MCNRIKYGILLGLFAIVSPLMAATNTYTIDPGHTYVLWHISHFGFSHPAGKWLATGHLEMDEEKLANSKANVEIDVSHMITGIPELDKHLLGKGFFDADKFPKATFVSTKVETTNHQISKVHGNLNVKGVTKPVVLEVKFNKKGKNIINDRETVGYSAKTSIKRSDFGITTGLPGLGDEVKLDIELEAFIPEAADNKN